MVGVPLADEAAVAVVAAGGSLLGIAEVRCRRRLLDLPLQRLDRIEHVGQAAGGVRVEPIEDRLVV
jgi:hypothetical protein